MKLLAVPLARLSPKAAPLLSFVAVPPLKAPTRDGPPPLSTRLLTRAADFWAGLGTPGQKSIGDWKRRTYVTGERLMDRIEYEEWALKGIDPSLGPATGAARKGAQPNLGEKLSLLHPPGLGSAHVMHSLSALAARRTPHHRRRLVWCIVGMPFTAPFALIPVVPNLPFFYLVWRAYSHWSAYRSSSYLSELLAAKRIVPEPSQELDDVLRTPAPPPTLQEAHDGKASETAAPAATPSAETPAASPAASSAELLLLAHHVPALVSTFKLDHQRHIDLDRARAQLALALRKNELASLERAVAEGAAVAQEKEQKQQQAARAQESAKDK